MMLGDVMDLSVIDDIAIQGGGSADYLERLILDCADARIAAGDMRAGMVLERVAREVARKWPRLETIDDEIEAARKAGEASGYENAAEEFSVKIEDATALLETESLFIQWLLAERRRYQDRAGAPTIADIRAHGVSRREIREYLRDTGWACDALDVGVCRTRGQWQDGPPTWSHPDHAPALDLRHDDITIAALAEIEQRSPWAVLDDVSAYGNEREIYHNDTLVALARGRRIQRASDGAAFDTCAE